MRERRESKTGRLPARRVIEIQPAPTIAKPAWIRVRLSDSPRFREVKRVLREQRLHTECEEASCPNIGERFCNGTATFMVLGDLCIRRCPFCDVAHGRPGADYANSLDLLKAFKAYRPQALTKSGLMLGLGETDADVVEVMRDLRRHGVDMLTVGQYLRPLAGNLPVWRYVTPDGFTRLEQLARAMGFAHVACGPLVRADQQALAAGAL